MADLYQTEQVQLVLFEAFFADGEKEQSRTLDIYDALPKFSLSWAREGEQQSSLREFNNVRIQDKLIKVSVSAAILSSGSEPGSKDTQAKKPKTVFPGVREELVERALRKMAVQRQIDARLEADDANGRMIPITFTLSQLRKELTSAGHDFKISELREALDVLGRASLTVEGIVDDDINGLAHPILLISYKRRRGDNTGDYSYYTAKFHPLAVRAILAGAWQPINYERVMRLELPLARWIATRMNNRYRSAEKAASMKGKGYYLTLSRVLAESGIMPEKRLRATVERVRAALAELRNEGFLDRLNKPYDEEITYERAKGRPRISDVKWTLYPSTAFAEEIISGNVQVRHQLRKTSVINEGVGSAKGGFLRR
jgi:hypothetical protein